jgi:hypothetical protein
MLPAVRPAALLAAASANTTPTRLLLLLLLLLLLALLLLLLLALLALLPTPPSTCRAHCCSWLLQAAGSPNVSLQVLSKGAPVGSQVADAATHSSHCMEKVASHAGAVPAAGLACRQSSILLQPPPASCLMVLQLRGCVATFATLLRAMAGR